MLILLHVVSLALSSSLIGSTPISSDPPHQLFPLTKRSSSSSIPTDFGQRSTWDIVWGCLATIFACSWVSVHPNIPPPDTKWWRIALIRLELMVWTILAPEIIILLAARQWLAARQLKKVYQERGWTITHGFFIQMGGFMLFDGGIRKGVLSPSRFQELTKAEKIVFPEITEEEIKDRSKGDGLSKGLVLLQVAWFIVQITARIAEGLAITQLELATFAFAALNGFMYFFWWNKPLDIRLPIPIHLIHPTVLMSEDIASPSVISRPSEASTEPLDNTPPEQEQSPEAAMPSPKENSNTKEHFLRRYLWPRSIQKAWDDRFHVVKKGPDLELQDRMSVPIFFSSLDTGPSSTVQYGYAISIVLGMVFGAIHCAGWNLIFPSVSEERMWRIASVVIVAYPASFLVGYPLRFWFPKLWTKIVEHWDKRFLWIMVGNFIWRSCFPFYIIARIFILLEAFLSLRNLSDSATYAVQWTTFLPHV